MAMSKGMTGKIGPASVKQDITLGDYIARIDSDRSFPEKKKLTFEEWWQNAGGVDLNHVKKGDQWYGPFIDKATFKLVWETAQENV